MRHDTDYYLPRHYKLLERLNGSGHTIKKLYEVSRHIVDGPFGSAIKADDYVEIGIPFIRVADVTHGDGTLKTKDMIYISEGAHQAIKRSTAVPGDVIIAKTGATMGAASIVPLTIPEANIRGDLALVGKLKSWADADYLSAFINTDIGYKLFWRLNSGSTRGRVVISNLKKFPIIWPESVIRQRIVEMVEEGRRQKNKRLAEANALLASIDVYLLSELGIALPPEPENSIDNRMFRTNAHVLSGWRFDARVHQHDFALSSGKFTNVRLATVCAINPRTVFRGLTEAEDVSFVPMDAISDRLGIIQRHDTRPLSENVGYTSFQDGDLLWAKITPCMENGKSAVASGLHKGFGFGSTEYHVLRCPDDRLDIGYLHALLRMLRVRRAAVRFFTGASGHQRVDADFLKTLEIPLPPIGLQRALSAEVRDRVAKSVALEAEARAELNRAKSEIEAVLLGDAA